MPFWLLEKLSWKYVSFPQDLNLKTKTFCFVIRQVNVFKIGCHMYHFRTTQSPRNICTGFDIGFKCDPNLLQNVFFQIKASVFFASGHSRKVFYQASALDIWTVSGFRLLFINFKELELFMKSLVWLQAKLKQVPLAKCDKINSYKSFQCKDVCHMLNTNWYQTPNAL